MPLSKENLSQIVTSSDFSKLVGEVENEWFDCKGQPYILENERQKMELSKDISSFSNYQGGYIFLGIKTEKLPDKYGDVVKEIVPFGQDLVDIGQYYDVIKERVYPEIHNITIEWKPVTTAGDKGIVVVHIPAQKEASKPYLVGKTVDDDDKRIEIVFGYFERRRDTSEHLKIGDLQRALKSGFSYEKNMSERLDVIEGLLKNSSGNKLKGKMVFEEPLLNEVALKSRVDDAIKAIGGEQKRLMILSAYPYPLTELRTVFSSSPDSIRRKLENPPYLRYSGWNINTLDQSRIVQGKAIRVKNGDRKVIDLYRDGGMIFSCLADEKFLAWTGTATRQFFYSLSLIEVIYEFVRFYKLVTEDMKTSPVEITLKARFKNMHLNNVITGISPYKLNSNQVPLPVNAPTDEFEVMVDCNFTDFDAGKMAYRLVEEIYLSFGVETNIIPYAKDTNGVKEIDPEQILAV
jgi:hypothetical protein